jgi:flagellar motor switch/type III secretory pathway protein FliN
LSGLGDSTLTCNGILGCDVKSLQITGRNQQLPNMAHNESDTNVKNNDSWVSLKVAIQEKINIPFDKLLCWRPDDEIYLEHSLKQYLATILLENQVIASGHLISIANGYGVYIETYKDMQDQWT